MVFRQLAAGLAHAMQSSAITPVRVRTAILRRRGIKIDANVRIYHSTFFGSGNCAIGEGSFISVNCFIDGSQRVTIGRRVHIASGVRLVTSTHAIGPPSQRAGDLQTAPIVVGDGCWLGASCTVLPGITIANGCVIAAGALVARDTEPNGLYAGLPARRIRDLPT